MLCTSYVLLVITILGKVYAIKNEPYEICFESVKNYSLPKLNFEYNELEPFIDSVTVESHYSGHHDAYRQKLDKALSDWREKDPTCSQCRESIVSIIQHQASIPPAVRLAVQNNGGGFINHAFYWGCISPNPSAETRLPSGKLLADIMAMFGDFEKFKEQFTATSLSVFGSGYVWLSRHPLDSSLVLSITANQDSPISEGLCPILVIDLWEHAYYLKHKFRRANYVADWWMLVDWKKVEKLDQWWRDINSSELKHEL